MIEVRRAVPPYKTPGLLPWRKSAVEIRVMVMRKQFPVPKGLGSRSFADQYPGSRPRRSKRDGHATTSPVKFQGATEPFNFSLGRSKSDSHDPISWVFFLIPALPPLCLLAYILFG